MSKHILNLADVELHPFGHGDKFEARIGSISPRVGAQKLGYNVTVVPARCKAFPLHSHKANEEMFFIIEGSGELRVGAERFPLKQGDVVCCPPGGPETAHQIVNTSNAMLRYLAVSTEVASEVCEYPDSQKFAVWIDTEGVPKGFRFIGRSAKSVDYWDGE